MITNTIFLVRYHYFRQRHNDQPLQCYSSISYCNINSSDATEDVRHARREKKKKKPKTPNATTAPPPKRKGKRKKGKKKMK